VGQLGLILGRIDERVLVVVEEPEVAVEAHVDAGWLNHRVVRGREPDAPGGQLSLDVPVG
jgi:hypothetical protein